LTQKAEFAAAQSVVPFGSCIQRQRMTTQELDARNNYRLLFQLGFVSVAEVYELYAAKQTELACSIQYACRGGYGREYI